MGVEIERKFLVVGRPWEGHPGERIVQAVVASQEGRVVRVRQRGYEGTLTVKGPSVGASRPEFEVSIPVEMVGEITEALRLTAVIHKVRFLVPVGRHTWEIDVFEGANAGLVVAELELDDEQEDFERPGWLGEEVTEDLRYCNAALAERPWSAWGGP